MTCDVAKCSRRAEIVVTFTTGGEYPFCHWHSHRSNGELRWAPEQVRSVRRAA